MIIGIVSGKGGVGKTTLSINIGMALSKLGKNVSVIDGDIKNPNLGLYLGLYGLKYTINDFIRGEEQDGYDYHGMKIFPSSLSLDESTSVSKIRKVVESLEGYIIIDFPPGLNRDIAHLMDVCHKYIVITNPNMVCLASTMRLSHILKGTDKDVMGIIVNRTGKKHDVERDEIEAAITDNIMGHIPEDDNITMSMNSHKPVLEYNPYAPSSIEIMDITSKMIGLEYKRPSGFIKIRNFLSQLRVKK
ncbi:P-loop NTPase [Candidatus Aenigmatarchaeota archaeon]